MELICFNPIYQQRVWGGRHLESRLGRTLPDQNPYGESWEIVDRPEAQSRDSASGKTLREWIETAGDRLMGPTFDRRRTFPILVKWLDCKERLSLQVHPPASVADELGGEPKTENWFVAEATSDASLIVGLKHGTTREAFAEGIREEKLEPLVHRFPVRAGQSILVESGRLHAIDAGNLILEIQQNSDTTYRVYDWGRKGLDGKARQLHIEESMRSIDFDDFEPAPLEPFDSIGEAVLADCAEFRIRRINLTEGETLAFPANQQPRIISVVTGKIGEESSGRTFGYGTNFLVPYARESALRAVEEASVLVTDNFIPGT